MKNIWCCKSFTPGRLLRDELVLKCSHEGAAALIILKQWHPYSEEQKSHFFEASSSMVVVARFCLWPCLFPLLVNHGAKVRRQLSAYHIFPINSQPPPLEPPRMVIFHFTKVTRSENCGQSGRRALNWGRRLPAASELLIKTQRPPISLKTSKNLQVLLCTAFSEKTLCILLKRTKIFDNVVVSLDLVKKAVVFLEKRWRQRWLIRMQIYAAYNATLLTVSIYNIQYSTACTCPIHTV